MPEKINKDAFIANILECFTLLQTYEECYKEILDIIDVVNGLNESDLTIANLKNLIEGSEYISFAENETGTKLVINLDKAHLDNVPTANSTHLVTSGGVQKSIANTQSALENTIDAKTQGMLKLPINIPTEPLVVMVDTNNVQTNVPLGDGLAYQNGHLVATGGGGGDVTKAYVDAQDTKLQQSINATDTQVQALNEEVATIKTNTIPAINNTLDNKLDKMTSTGSGVKVYVHEDGVDKLLNATSDKTRNLIVRWDNNAQLHANAGTTDDAVVNKKQLDDGIANKLDKATTTSGSYAYCRNGNNDETIPVNPLVGNNAIVRRTSTGTIKANAGVDENDCVNKKQLDDAIAGVSGGGAQINVANTWTALQTFNAGANISGQGDIDLNGSIRCDGNLTLAGGDILQGGTGNFSELVTSFGDGGLQFTTTQVPLGTYTLFKVTYKYSSRDWTDTYKVTTTKHGYTKTLITNEDINTTDFTWNSTDNKLALNTRIVSCDQTFYDNLTNKDKNTLYVIVG